MVALNLRALVVGILALAIFVAISATAFAKPPTDGTRPGWGFGDKNHTHTGPPGQSVHPVKTPAP